MSQRPFDSHSSRSNRSRRQERKQLQRRENLRRSLLETLESRQLLAVGPQLIGVQPNNSELIENGVVRTIAPKELVFRFDDTQSIDPATLSGIRISRAGGDGTFGLPTNFSDVGTAGNAKVRFTSTQPGLVVQLNFVAAPLAAGTPVSFTRGGNTLTVTLSTTAGTTLTAQQLVDAVNTSPSAAGLVTARLEGGQGNSLISPTLAAAGAPLVLQSSGDEIITNNRLEVRSSPNDNEVVYRFAENLPDDLYRIEVFGFDDPARGVTGLRSRTGDFFTPSATGSRQDTITFRLDLGTKISGVVPQPIYRNADGSLNQQRDTIVVYFDGDSQFVENDSMGRPTARSVENPEFYQLFYTANTARNTDDVLRTPTSVDYNAVANTATLRFAGDLAGLVPGMPNAAFRLRVGNRESVPIVPRAITGAAAAVTDFNSNNAVRVRFHSRSGAEGAGPRVVVQSQSTATPVVVSVVGNDVFVAVNPTATANDIVAAIAANPASDALLTAEVITNPASGQTVVGNRPINYGPIQLVGLGDTFDTASNLGLFPGGGINQTSLIVASSIDPQRYDLDLLGSPDDPGSRNITTSDNFENHINPAFGADKPLSGITEIRYNFRGNYVTGGVNAITPDQQQRVREAISLWSNYLGIQFVETANEGVTFALGAQNLLASNLPAGTEFVDESGYGFAVRVDPTFNDSAVVLSGSRSWNVQYGEDFFRHVMVGLGEVLGLTHARDLPASVLMSMNQQFLDAIFRPIDDSFSAINARDVARNFEPIFPSPQDILHGQYVHRPDSSDIDLYKFTIDLDNTGRDQVGLLTIESFAERLINDASSLDSYLRLYRQAQASAVSSLGVSEALGIEFAAVAPGAQGNNLRIFFTASNRGTGPAILSVSENRIDIDLDSAAGSVTTAAELISLLNSDPATSALVRASLLTGSGTTLIGDRVVNYSPVVLSGGGMELVAQNDDYYSEDSLIRLSLGSGVYFLGVSASGNDEYNPVIANTGFGGRTQGKYELRINFRAQTDLADSISDISGGSFGDTQVVIDGDGDGTPGGVFDYWFETRPLQRIVSVNAGGNASYEGQFIRLTNANGTSREFEFSADTSIGNGRVRIPYTVGQSAASLTAAIAATINSSGLGISAIANGDALTLNGERLISLSTGLSALTVHGKTIIVDKAGGANADGSLARPFNNLANTGTTNAFAAAQPGDIVRVVSNGGQDGDLRTVQDNFAYEVGVGLLNNNPLSDGSTLEVPKGTVLMVDPGVVFKMRRSRIGVGSSNLGIDRSGGAIQVLGTPVAIDAAGNAIRRNDGTLVSGNVFFTSWLDESIGFDNYGPRTTPQPGDWGGITMRRDVDDSVGRTSLEDEGIFLNYVNQADIRFGGGGNVVIDSVQQVVNPIQMLDTRPTVTFNRITRSADNAMSAAPNSFEETSFTTPEYQINGIFTPDYDRVGPNIRNNVLLNNSGNGLFIRVDVLPGQPVRTLSFAGRFDDVDIVHILTSNLQIDGTPGGLIQDSFRPSVGLVGGTTALGGDLTAGTYRYRVSFVDVNGYESLVSDPSGEITVTAADTAITLNNLPAVTSAYRTRRLYRSMDGGQYVLVASLDARSTSFVDQGQRAGGVLDDRLVTGSFVRRPNLDASLVIDPGTIVKLEGALIEVGHDSQLLAEGTADLPIIFTSRLDDRYGAGGSFDTTNSFNSATGADPSLPAPGNWGGIYASPTSYVGLDSATVAFAGGIVPINGTFRGFNALELQQADARVVNSTFDRNADGMGGQGPETRFGRLLNLPTTVLIRGSQPIFVNNLFLNNVSDAVSIDQNSLSSDLQGDQGRMFGFIDRYEEFDNNRGPLVRLNAFAGNGINGMVVRADERVRDTTEYPQPPINIPDSALSLLREPVIQIADMPAEELLVDSVWDDADVVHVLRDGIFINNLQHVGGLRLQSSLDQSLVVKFDGEGTNFDRYRGAGITALGDLSSIRDRVGGILQVVGQPGAPVILTSLADDSIGAGLRPDGRPQTDTNNDGIGSRPESGDWRGLMIDQFAHDRNVAELTELEREDTAAPGPNGSTTSAEFLGQLASSETTSDENLRLGFIVNGIISTPGDQDIYSFSGVAGTEVWLDIDRTDYSLDTVIELLDSSGSLIARSNDSTAEQVDPSLLVSGPAAGNAQVRSLVRETGISRRTAGGLVKEDYTFNPRDAGFRITLPGSAGTRSNFFFRVRSAGLDITNPEGGLTTGAYEVQLRLREAQEFAGSVVQYADVRYATNGLHMRGQPGHSSLLGDIAEDEDTFNDQWTPFFTDVSSNNVPYSWPVKTQTAAYSTGARSQYVGNVLESDRGVISIAGELESANIFSGPALDFYTFQVTEDDVLSSANGQVDVILDIDYADGLNRPDTSLALYRMNGEPGFNGVVRESAQLIYFAEESNVADDQAVAGGDTATNNLVRGSYGKLDPYLRTVGLTPGVYSVGVHSSSSAPLSLRNPQVRRVPVVQQRTYPDRITSGTERFPIDLAGTTGSDAPTFYFNTDGVAVQTPNGQFFTDSSVRARVELADGTTVAVPGVFTRELQGRIKLGNYGSATNRPVAVQLTPEETVSLSNISFGFAEYGEQVVGAPVYGDNIYYEPTLQVDQVTPSPGVSTSVFSATDNNLVPRYGKYDVSLTGIRSEEDPSFTFSLARSLAADNSLIQVRIVSGTATTAAEINNGDLVASSQPAPGQGQIPLVVPFRGVNDTNSTYVTLDLSSYAGQSIQIWVSGGTQGPPVNSVVLGTGVLGLDALGVASGSTATVATGPYQLEIRKVIDRPGTADNFDRTTTNIRNADGTSLVLANGSDIVDGQQFQLSDGLNQLLFEFDNNDSVAGSAIRVPFTTAMTANEVAANVRDAINSQIVQSVLRIQAASATGERSGLSSTNRLDLFGNATADVTAAGSSVTVVQTVGSADPNVFRDQGQIIVSNNYFRHNRDYGVWMENGSGQYDYRDLIDGYSGLTLGSLIDGDISGSTAGDGARDDGGTLFNRTAIIQPRPPMVGSGLGAAKNMPILNDQVVGGFTAGPVVSSNVIEQSGIGGVHVEGENAIWMITPAAHYRNVNGAYAIFPGLPRGDNQPTSEEVHFGATINDGDAFTFDAGRLRSRFEFEDLAGGGAGGPVWGSGAEGGNGWGEDATPIFYREEAAALYRRGPGQNNNFGYSALEVMHAMRDALNGSLLVTNGTTQTITATVGMSLLDPSIYSYNGPANLGAPDGFSPNVNTFLSNTYPDWANLPALFVEGVNNIFYEPGAPIINDAVWDIRRVDKASAPQLYARVLNNTIYGNDGRASFNAEAAEPQSGGVRTEAMFNDIIDGATETQQGVSHNPLSYITTAELGNSGMTPGTDVDFYKFHLDLGERVWIDIDSAGANTVLSIFDQNGRPVDLSNGTAATPRYFASVASGGGGSTGDQRDIDYTAIAAGTYYVAVSGEGNTGFNALSLADRTVSTQTGSYTIDLRVLHPQQFVIDVESAADYADGDTFTIYSVADYQIRVNDANGQQVGTRSTNELRFEFTTDLVITPGNYPIYIGPNFKQSDIARSIAQAIDASPLNNTQNLPNGTFGNNANPLPPVSARPLGGFEGVEPGLRLFPYRQDTTWATLELQHSSEGIGHDHVVGYAQGTGSTTFSITNSSSPGDFFSYGYTADGRGTVEKWVVINGAAWIDGNRAGGTGGVIVDPDINSDYNLDQLVPETGVMISGGASPTLLNNVFLNVQTPIVREESRSTRDFELHEMPEPFGSTDPLALDRTPKPGQQIIAGSVYQNFETREARIREGNGIETAPTNLPNTSGDFNLTANATQRLVVDAEGSNFLPASGSILIDSSIDTILDRANFSTVKQGAGVQLSPVQSPRRDANGLLRVDDPNVAPPQGVGANVFIDRGAVDRADFIGPTAILVNPQDNDANGRDIAAETSMVRLLSGVLDEIKIQLVDGFDAAEPFPGLGVDDASVVQATNNGNQPGRVVTLTENGRLLTEGIDYTFAYNQTTNEIILTPLAGIFRDGRVYEVTINNRDRFVAMVPAGQQIRDGQQFTITDSQGGQVVFEFDSGSSIVLPTALSLQLPPAGGQPGGLVDGERFTITAGAQSLTFEFDNNSVTLPGSTAINLRTTDTVDQVAASVVAAINASSLGLSASDAGNGRVILGASNAITMTTQGTSLSYSSSTAGLRVDNFGAIGDGQVFTVNDSVRTVTFEFDRDGNVAAGNVSINAATATSNDELAAAIRTAILNSGLIAQPQVVAGNIVSFGLNGASTVTSSVTGVVPVGVSRRIVDGDTVVVSVAGTSYTFEFDNDGTVASGRTAVALPASGNEATIATALAAAINATVPGARATAQADGVVDLNTEQLVTIDTSNAQVIQVAGSDGVSSNTRIAVGTVQDGEFFTVNHQGQSVTFEFDNTSSNSGQVAGRRPIFISDASTPEQIAIAIASELSASLLALSATASGASISIDDLPTTSYDLSNAPSLTRSGFAGGVITVPISPSSAATADQIASTIFFALREAKNNGYSTTAEIGLRGGSTLFVENALNIEGVESFFLQGVRDLAGNLLRPNRINDETQYTVLTPGIVLDYGDAPDPFQFQSGRYATLSANSGPAHVRFDGGITLGSTVTVEIDGQPTQNATGDSGDDGVVFTGPQRMPIGFATDGIISREIETGFVVTVSKPGVVDAWIDYNADGDFDDAGEQVINSIYFRIDSLSQSFPIQLPSGINPPSGSPAVTYARFRVSDTGQLTNSGLATSGEVEDYSLTILPISQTPVQVASIPVQSIAEDQYTVNPLSIPLLDTYFRDPDSFDVLEFSAISSDSTIVRTGISGNNLLLYTQPDRSGTVTVTVRATDITGKFVESTFTVNVAAVDDRPRPVADNYTVPFNRPFRTFDTTGTLNSNTNDDSVLLNDVEVDGQSLTASLVTQASKGFVSLNADGTFIYTPNSNLARQGETDTFVYQASDGTSAPVTQVVTITFGEAAVSPLHNASSAEDVLPGTAPGEVTPIDALAVINFLNRMRRLGYSNLRVEDGPAGSADIYGRLNSTGVDTRIENINPAPYLDVIPDFQINVQDFLAVINRINQRSRNSGSGEGEPSIAASSEVQTSPIGVIDVIGNDDSSISTTNTVTPIYSPVYGMSPVATLDSDPWADLDLDDDQWSDDLASDDSEAATVDAAFADFGDLPNRRR